MPFGDFIVDKVGVALDKVGAHSRYYPGEWASDRCRLILSQIWKEFRDRDAAEHNDFSNDQHQKKLRAAFDTICDHHSPVFRYFFIENFPHPENWYASKTRYTRSVAVSSMVGHILGIGKSFILCIAVYGKRYSSQHEYNRQSQVIAT